MRILHDTTKKTVNWQRFGYKRQMKLAIKLILLTGLLSSHAVAKVIYGKDNRHEVFQAETLFQNLAQSTPTMVAVERIHKPKASGTIDLDQVTFLEWIESQGAEKSKKNLLAPALEMSENTRLTFCIDERFTEQPNPGLCSGFLIAHDLLVTAGHCAQLPDACDGYKWVFDFKVDEHTGKSGLDMNPDDIYSCQRIITKSLSLSLGTDYAIIKLDRKVTDRTPLEIRYQGVIEDNNSIVVIGNPSGLPLKVSNGARVRDNTHSLYFSANLDTFQGNSGSAVFDAETGMVEGILVRGEEDFMYDVENMCLRANQCEDDSCRGEDVSRITSIPEVALKNVFHTAAEDGDAITLKKLLALNIWVDFYGSDGISALMKAAANGKHNTMAILLAHGAEANLTDAEGNTALHHLARVLSNKNEEALSTLIAADVKLNVMNNKGQTPMMVAESSGNIDGLLLLIKAKVWSDPFRSGTNASYQGSSFQSR
jgi:hypothetical protein